MAMSVNCLIFKATVCYCVSLHFLDLPFISLDRIDAETFPWFASFSSTSLTLFFPSIMSQIYYQHYFVFALLCVIILCKSCKLYYLDTCVLKDEEELGSLSHIDEMDGFEQRA